MHVLRTCNRYFSYISHLNIIVLLTCSHLNEILPFDFKGWPWKIILEVTLWGGDKLFWKQFHGEQNIILEVISGGHKIHGGAEDSGGAKNYSRSNFRGSRRLIWK